ncbi:MAG: hypothetical protein AVDCRST_MAG73-1118 [uncultured Thermomicrobiales bacterium]|uniref:5'-deoxynucleotidase n=1 Tax=uncultured Thermomicrobiales bacterium TaxID=1645740 RepID=A0A6J4TWQ2_9BACT|nr:MAG: hypothetical protein AVDCRST_MAG73-1118 [uncultured Thermomicrobiales bacterium]
MPAPPCPNDAPQPAGLARFLRRAAALKRTPRTGWLHCGVPPAETESVADHAFGTALLAWLAATGRPDLDRDRVLKLALIHDLAEAVSGDPTPYDPADLPADPAARAAFLNRPHVRGPERQAIKRAAETAAMDDLLGDLPVDLAAELRALWDEAEARATPEARFVKQADKLEAFLQSRRYAAEDPGRPVASFAADAQTHIDDPILSDLRGAIAADPGDPEISGDA